jgi:hypothetical protein
MKIRNREAVLREQLPIAESVMVRWFPKAIPACVISIALYFVLYFGIDAIRVLTSPVYGLDQSGFAQLVHGIGRRFAFGGEGLIRIATFFGAAKLAIAILFAVYVASRIRALLGHETDHEIVDAGVLLIVLVTVAAATPALIDGETHLLSEYRLPLWLAGLAATLSMIERVVADERRIEQETARQRFTIYDVTLPPRRNSVSTLRWDVLRRTANVVARPALFTPRQPICLSRHSRGA